MAKSKMQTLAEFGQSIWLDYIDRPLLETGKLKMMIADGLCGMTSNPTIFNNAIGLTSDYDDKIRMLKQAGKSTFEIYDELTIRDIQEAADHFKGVYEHSQGLDGYVSLEIDPQIAHKADEQIQEGMRLFQKVNRPNVMIKVPSTPAGIPVIEQLIANGVSVNATLIFGVGQFEQVAQAYYRGLTLRAAQHASLKDVRSVASVFVSRIDTAVDQLIDKQIKGEADESKRRQLSALKGKAAVANSVIIFEKWKEILEGSTLKSLAAQHANVQRVLWASTGTKNPDYSDIKYVTELISAPTVNTLPEKTLNAFLDHGAVTNAFDRDPRWAFEVVAALRGNGIDVDAVCADLLTQGVASFDEAFQQLTASIEKKAAALSSV